MEWNEIWNNIVNFCTTHGLVILNAIIAFLLGVIVIKIIFKIMIHFMSKSKLAPITQTFLKSVLKIVLYVLLVFIVLQILGVPITGLATVLATAGVAISLALKDSLSNVAYGLILISTKPFYQGDYVAIGGQEGTVKAINIMSTQIITTDNKKVIIPNATVYSSAIVNFSARGSRRMEMLFDVAYDTDIEKAQKIMIDVCKANGKIMLNPEPEAHLKYFKDDNISLFLTCWTKGPYWEIYFYLMDNVYNEFKRNGIKINYKQVEVRMRDDEVDMPYRKEKLPKRKEIKEDNEKLTLFDSKSLKELKNKAKRKRMKYLEEKKKKLEKELSILREQTISPETSQYTDNKQVVIKNPARVVKSSLKFKLK